MPEKQVILEAKDLTRTFQKARTGLFEQAGTFTAVDQVSFQLFRGETLGLLGESGCGKSTLARMLMHLLQPTAGEIRIGGTRTDQLSEKAFRPYRQRIQMVYQNPFDCLDPSMRISQLLAEPFRIWQPEISAADREEKILTILSECGLPESSLDKYPREFSGGQLQRLSIARALLIEPEILIADEIISALDVSIQNQILSLLKKMKASHHLSVLFVTHDLSVARKISDRVMVMQSGQLKGIGTPDEVFSNTADPYIQELSSAVFTFKAPLPQTER
jgi:ABC-type oligopeptide transport system ATPase subunit